MAQNQNIGLLGQYLTVNSTANTITFTGSIANTITFTGSILANTVNAASHTVGTSFIANTSQVTLSGIPLSVNSAITANGSLGTAGWVLTSAGGANVYWAASSGGAGGGATITNDTSSASSLYVPFTSTTSGTMSTANVSTTKLYFVPSTGTLNSTIFNSLSDVNHKTNINTIGSALDIITSLRGVSFNWKDNNRPSYGLIAQEVEQIIPEIVTTNEDGVKTLNYDALIGFIIEAIKELKNG